jgi:uncharacterized caspase-like protein
MPKHVALVIGISEYRLLPKLTYAQKDAELMGQFLSETAGFNPKQGGEVCLCTLNSLEYKGYSTRPTRTELRRILRKGFTESFLDSEDCFWFFFSGHGVRYDDKDYLMPVDGDPEEPDETAIELNYVTERLTRSGAGQVVMILDACRSEGQKGSQDDFGQDIAKGVTKIFSCHPKEPSYEIGKPICQSAFTYVLLQSFRQQTSETALTVSQLEQYLQTEVPKLNQQHHKPPQRPHIRCDFAASGNQIVLPHLRVPLTIEQLKANAYQAEALGEWEKARKYWLAVLRSSTPHSHEHQEADKGYERVILRSQSGQGVDSSKQGIALPQVTPAPALPPEDNLSSERGIDYTRLQDLLKTRQWEEADRETYELMIQAVGKDIEGRFSSNDMLNFPRKDLETVDTLWGKHSDNRFGFSIQKRIYKNLGGAVDGKHPEGDIWEEFCIKIGWMQNQRGNHYTKLNYEKQNFTVGELPRLITSYFTDLEVFWSLLFRLESFQIALNHYLLS